MEAVIPERLGYYTKSLKYCLTSKAIKPATYKLGIMTFYLAIIIYIFISLRATDNFWFVALLSIPIGVLYASIFTYCHELSHGTIVKNKKLLYFTELLFWSINYMPSTLWRKVHNSNHHINTNNYKDPDRRTFKSEKSKSSLIYNLFIYPNRVLKYSITVGFAMIFYTWKHVFAAFYSDDKKPLIVTFKPIYSFKEKKKIAFELLFILLYQILLVLIVGSFAKYLLISLISYYISSLILISLIVTQHLINPHFKEASDPVLNSTSIKLPKILDFLVDYHSYHTEHHIFPGINFDYYPIVSKALQEHYPRKYNRIKFLTALKKAYSYDILIDDPLE